MTPWLLALLAVPSTWASTRWWYRHHPSVVHVPLTVEPMFRVEAGELVEDIWRVVDHMPPVLNLQPHHFEETP